MPTKLSYYFIMMSRKGKAHLHDGTVTMELGPRTYSSVFFRHWVYCYEYS